MTRVTPHTLSALLALVLLITTPLLSAADEEQEQERIALAWVAAHNAADVDAMANLRARHFQRSEVTDWQESFQSLIDRFGTFEVYAIMFTGSGDANFVRISSCFLVNESMLISR